MQLEMLDTASHRRSGDSSHLQQQDANQKALVLYLPKASECKNAILPFLVSNTNQCVIHFVLLPVDLCLIMMA